MNINTFQKPRRRRKASKKTSREHVCEARKGWFIKKSKYARNMYGFCSQTVPSRGALFHPLSQTPKFLKIGASRKAIRAIASNFLQRPNYQKTRKENAGF